jgi:hypothetical protein
MTVSARNFMFRHSVPVPCPAISSVQAAWPAFPPETQICIWAEVANFNRFTEDNDPHGEHDFGAFDVEGAGTIFWKIDYYPDKSCTLGSEDPADAARTFRILTIMLASEY